MNKAGLHAEIFRWGLGDCSANGLSSRVRTVTILSDDPNAEGQVFEPTDDAPAVRIVRRAIWPGEEMYSHAEPIEPPTGCRMNGGTFIYSCDSRFHSLTGTRYPVPLHDRDEAYR